MQIPDTDTCLFDDDEVRVTPTWLTLDDTSHAMHTVIRVRLAENAVPRGSWTLLFYVSLVLIVLAGFGTRQEAMPGWLGFVLLTASLAVGLAAAWFAFVARDVYRLDVVLNDGSSLRIHRAGKGYMTRLEKALRQAMVLHRGMFREPMVERVGARPSAGSEAAAEVFPDRPRRPPTSRRLRVVPVDPKPADADKKRRDAAMRRWLAASAAGKLPGVQDQ